MAEPDVEKWWERVEQGVRYKEQYGGAKRWPVYRDYYRGDFPGYLHSVSGPRGILPYNLTFAMKNTMVPNIYFRNPYLTASPRYAPNFEAHAKMVEAIDNWLIQEMAIKSVMKHSVGNCYFTNRAFLKVGYDSEFGYDPSLVREDLGMTDTTTTFMDKKLKNRLEYNVNIRSGMPWVTSVSSENIIVPFGTYLFEDMPWIDHVVLRPLDDVKADQKYDKSATKELEGTHIETLKKDPRRATFFQELEKDAQWVELHEIRDRKTGKIIVIVPGHDKFLRNETDVLQIEGLPFVSYTFNDDTEYFWGASDAQIIEPQQLEMNESRTLAMKHRRISMIKFLFQQNGIDPAEIDKFMSEEVGPGVRVKGDPKTVVSTLQPHIPLDLAQWTEVIRGDSRELLGIGRQQMGEADRSSRRSATESQIIQLAHELRMDERRDAMADALVQVMRKVNQVIFKLWDKKHISQVVGFDGAKYWVEYTNKAIIGEYSLSVDVESMTPQTKELRRRDIIQLIQALGKHPGANVDHLMRTLLREFPWVDAMKVLPEGQGQQGGPIPAEKFQADQNRLRANPQALQAAARQNAAQLQ